MSGRILGYGYSEGPAAQVGSALAATAALQAVNAVAAIEQAYPGTTVYARTAATALFTAQLTEWGTSLTLPTPAGGVSGSYTLSYNATTRRVTFSCTVTFRPVMPANLAAWLGFTQDLSAGWAASWTGEAVPGACVELVAVTVEPLEDWSQVDLAEYEHGRPVSTVWGNHQVHRVQLIATGEAATALRLGFLQAGKVRIYQDIDDATPYGPAYPGGYIEGFVIAASEPRDDGDLAELWSVRMLIGVPR